MLPLALAKEKEGDQIVKLPKLGSKSWTDWNDKFPLKISFNKRAVYFGPGFKNDSEKFINILK